MRRRLAPQGVALLPVCRRPRPGCPSCRGGASVSADLIELSASLLCNECSGAKGVRRVAAAGPGAAAASGATLPCRGDTLLQP